ncbi:hypothetical protein QL285_081541 [Trifolium repens]|nr:hypothetical protein QL285_081541 [Trifolium repens]
MFAALNNRRINTVPFLFSHMHSLVTAKNEKILFGGLITTLAKALGLGPQLRNLPHIPPRLIDEDMVRSMNLVRLRSDDRFDLMISNRLQIRSSASFNLPSSFKIQLTVLIDNAREEWPVIGHALWNGRHLADLSL